MDRNLLSRRDVVLEPRQHTRAHSRAATMGDVLITVAPQDKNGPGHLPNLESEMVKIKKAFGIRADAHSCISAGRLGRRKQTLCARYLVPGDGGSHSF